MSAKIVRLGSERSENEGIRIGTVRRPPRGVPKEEFASRNYYDVWFPNLAPSAETMKLGQKSRNAREWEKFVQAYKREMKQPSAHHDIRLLAKLSHSSNFSVGCYCEDEARCHRSVLGELLREQGAKIR